MLKAESLYFLLLSSGFVVQLSLLFKKVNNKLYSIKAIIMHDLVLFVRFVMLKLIHVFVQLVCVSIVSAYQFCVCESSHVIFIGFAM